MVLSHKKATLKNLGDDFADRVISSGILSDFEIERKE
jgi:hypothetical protein